MKKITIILLTLCLLLGGMALAEEGVAPPMGEAVWLYDETNNSVYVEGELQGDVTIPASINEHASYALQFSALCDQNSVTSLTLPDTMYVLQETAVANMSSLQSVTLNDGLEVIAASNFNRCPSLTSVTIPASVKLIDNAFMQCDSLKEIRFTGVCPTFVQTAFCFWWMPDDYVIYVPDDQYDAYAAALQDANGAVDHLQPSGQNAVLWDSKAQDDWFVFDADTGAINGYTQYHAYLEIPGTIGGVAVKSISEQAMRRDYSLFGVVLPEGLEYVGKEAFYYAGNLCYVKLPSTLKTIDDDAFNHIKGSRIEWSEGLETIGARAFQGNTMTTLTLPSTVKTIGEGAFERTPLGELHLSGDLQSIGSRAFVDCFLTYMAFDFHEPIDIAPDAFAGSNVADLDLPWDSSFENQAAYAEILREQCPNCTVWINNPVNGGVAENPIYDESICMFENGVWTMYQGDQPELTPWTWYDDIQVSGLGDGVFKGNQTIRSFYPHHCCWFTTIGDEAFADSSVEYVELFGSITTIGNGAFRNCLNIKELILPASLTSIGADALAGCDNLQTLTVLCDPAILPDGLLDECFAHTQIYAAPNATDEQVRILSEKAHRPWYAPVSRVGEPVNDLVQMPYAMFLIDDFWYDTEYARLDRYHGYELNLYLPREAEGMSLNTIGGDMMGRARGGDNYDMELPVRSVVVPENYTNIAYGAFIGCETLETFICYAPLDSVPDCMFQGCTNLREVVFVNGVRSVGSYVFDGCENLETVYLGQYVQQISETAFEGCNGFDQSKCITDPALMPDVEALLTAVKSAPMPEPTPEPTPAPAVPVGEAGAPYVGLWQADILEMDGESYPVADMGMEMNFTLNADGTAESYDGEVAETGTWTVENGVVTLDGMPMTAEDGKLVMEEDGMKLIFVKEDGASVPAADAAPVSGDGAAYVGTWQANLLEMDGESYPVADMGLVMYFTLNADGTAESYDGEVAETGTWAFENGAVIVDGVEIQVTEDGRLLMEDADSKLFFVRTDAAPDVSAIEAEPVSPETETAASVDLSSRMDIRYVCQSAETEGVTLDASLLGGEYSLTLHADGTADFVMVGSLIPGLPWTQDGETILIDYFGNSMVALPTETGFDLNFFDSMLLHLVAAQ